MNRRWITAVFAAALALLGYAQVRADNSLQGQSEIKVKNLDVVPPTLEVTLTHSGGGPSSEPGDGDTTVKLDGDPVEGFDFEDGKTQCVVRYWSGRQCHLNWTATGAETVTITPTNLDRGLSIPGTLDPNSGHLLFYNRQFDSGRIITFTITATNAAGSVSREFTIRRYSCFLAGTLVLMADGSYKKIEDIKNGDMVMSYDTQKKQLVPKAVIARTERISQDGYYVMNKDLKVTPNHLFYGNGEWTRTRDLKVGDSLLNPNGEPVAITSLERVETPVPVYNLITEGPQDYFVRMNGEDVLVHNQRKGQQIPDKGLLAGTLVLLADGRRVPAEKVKVGDRLLSYDRVTNRYEIIRVHGTDSQQSSGYLVVNGDLKIGPAHPIYKVDPKTNKRPHD